LSEETLKRGIVRVYVPDEAIRDGEFLNSVVAQPVTEGHPPEFVNSSSARSLQIGMSKGAARVVNGSGNLNAEADLRIIDADMVKAIDNDRVREVSIGNMGRVDLTPGSRGSVQYDATMDQIRVNHIAIVNRGRGGRDVRLLNEEGNERMETVTRVINAIEVQVAKQDAQLVDTLLAEVTNGVKEVATVKAELENLKTENAELKEQVENAAVTPDQLEKMAADRAEVVTVVNALLPKLDTKGLSIEGMKRAYIKTVNADLVSDESSVEVVNAVFDTLSKVNRTSGKQSESSQAAETVVKAVQNGPVNRPEATPREARSARRKERFRTINGLGRRNK